MPVERKAGTVVNARELAVDELVGERVLCPACDDKVFKVWPEGWDAHSAFKCPGARGNTPDERKADFKRRFHYLFR